MDGYYLWRDSAGKSLIRYYLYKNGKILQLSSDGSKEFFENHMNNMDVTSFFIKNDTIGFEQIFPWNSYPHYLYQGHILSDSSFTITKQIPLRYTGIFYRKTIKRNDTFYFEKSFKL